MRPSRSTAVASTTSKPAPELASEPRCIMCQAVAEPSSAEYWHMGETMMRLARSSFRRLADENSVLVLMMGPGLKLGDDLTGDEGSLPSSQVQEVRTTRPRDRRVGRRLRYICSQYSRGSTMTSIRV